VPLVR